MRLALFDLDHTLIPFDSGMAWTRHLVARGALQPDAEQRHLDFCHQYVAGTLDMHAMHRALIEPMARFDPAQLRAWRDEFARAISTQFSPAMLRRVAEHMARGDLCAIVTATSRLVAEPFARALAVEHLVATEPVLVQGLPTGAIDGMPCYRDHKVTKVDTWLMGLGASPLAGFEESWFYSDSVSDLALLRCVTHPVAVRPDPRLRDECRSAGWTILDEA